MSPPLIRTTRLKNMKTNRRKGGKRRQNTRIMAAGDIILKRFSLEGSVLGTGAGTGIAIDTFTSGYVQSAPATEWASFAARYQQYRVREIRLSLRAVNPVQSATVAHSQIYLADHLGSSVPSTPAQLLSDENVRSSPTWKDITYMTTWARNPNARLWNPTSAVIPTANQFAVSVGSASLPVLTTATTYFAVVVEWLVELRGSQ